MANYKLPHKRSRWLALLVFAGTALLTASAQETPRLAVNAGYSYLRFDSTTLGFADRTGLNGASGGVTFNLTPNFGLAAEVGGHYGPHLHVGEWLIGPRISVHKFGGDLFGHILFGQAQTRVDTGTPVTDSGRAFAAGGGIDFPIGSRFAVRVIQVDYLTTHSFDQNQGNLRISAGLVYRWGVVGKHKKAENPPAP